ncbi:hypothetical protein KAH27_08905, partial [bacterium]|nr:hypothetical protein [bacterium]
MTKKILLFCVAFILFTGRIFGNIDGSELSAVTDSYIPGETNTFIFRCDVVSPDAEWMHTVKVQYNPNMIVTAGFDSKGNQGNLIFIGYTGDGALSIWESDNGPDFGAISDKNSAFFSNTVFVTSAVTGDIVLTYYLLGDNYGIAPHSLTNTITLKQYKPSTIDSAALVSPSTINIDSYNFTPEITACLFIDGKTGTSGPAPEITAEIGVGVSGTTPDNSWEWQSTVYVGTDGTNDIFRTNLFVTVAGNQDYAVRFKQADEEWLVCDLDGGTNGYSPAQAGQMTANFLASVGDLQHEQTLQSSWVGTVVSFTNGAGENIIVADDVIFQVDTVVQTIRWKGMYRNDHKRDGIEDGFLFQIWEDDAGKPGTLFYSCFQPGYACEKVVNDLLFYQMILTNDLNLSGDTKYWWGIQMHTPGTAWWDISDTSDTPIGSLPMVKSTYFFVDDSWHADQVTFDLGVEFYGGFESDVYIKPQVQSGKGMVGSNVVYNLSILNKTGSDETFYLSDNSPWTATFPPNTGVIPNGASNNVSIVIDIPFDAANGTVVTSVITVAGSSKTNSAMLITEARWEYNVFSETFDAWPPEGWTNYFLADSTNGWEDWGAGNPPRCIRHPTIETLSSNWFVSPAINLQNISIAEKLQLTYDESMWGTSDYTYSSVMISSGDRNPANGDYVQLYEMIPIDQGYFWETIKMDILKYLGSNPV